MRFGYFWSIFSMFITLLKIQKFLILQVYGFVRISRIFLKTPQDDEIKLCWPKFVTNKTSLPLWRNKGTCS
jgi:hypothetical protein